MNKVFLSSTGFHVPEDIITNAELVESFNTFVANYNKQHEKAIVAGETEELRESSEAFILKASGIKNRYVIDKKNILDPKIMQPLLPERANSEISFQAEMCVKAATRALQTANKKAEEVDVLIVACSAFQRNYPAIAIEVQAALGCGGYAYDMNVACSSATFAMQAGVNALQTGNGKVALIINPEICSPHANFRDRDSHFIFGDACTATVLETDKTCSVTQPLEVISSRLSTQFSNNIRNNFGFMNRCNPKTMNATDKLFMQQGRQVFKEVIPYASKHILQHLAEENIAPNTLKRLWLHQANESMDHLIASKVLGRDATPEESPIILGEFANTASAGSVLCLHHHRQGLQQNEYALLSSFGAGYSVGSVLFKVS